MDNKNIITGLLVVLVIGVAIYFLTKDDDVEVMGINESALVENDNEINDRSEVGNDNSEVSTKSEVTNSVVLSPAETGNFAKVSSATLTKPGYVVIYQVDSNSDTKVIGNSDLLGPGTYTDLSIQLDAVIALKQTIVAVLHEDDGDGKFTADSSDPYLGNTNMAVVSDVDVVGVKAEDEDAVLQKQVETFLEKDFDSSTSTPTTN